MELTAQDRGGSLSKGLGAVGAMGAGVGAGFQAVWGYRKVKKKKAKQQESPQIFLYLGQIMAALGKTMRQKLKYKLISF